MGHHACSLRLLFVTLIVAPFEFCNQVQGTALSAQDDGVLLFTHRRKLSEARFLLDGGSNNTRETVSALEAFRRGLTRDPNGALNSWNTTINPNVCKWAGVSCTPSGNVSAVNLTGMGLMGTISPSLGSLRSLISLDLGGNNFSGAIPRSFGSLRKLTYLDLSRNSLAGSIPVEITNCSSLSQALFSNNLLSGGIPSGLGKLKNISVLNLSYNNLTHSIPRSVGNCSLLQQLILSNNNLSGFIPPDIGKLRKLTKLDLTFNSFVGQIPKSLTNCSLLETLELNNNELTGPIMPEFSRLQRLTKMHLFLNFLNGTIPRSLGNMTSLRSLQMGGHDEMSLTGTIPRELGNLKNIEWLVIYESNITGQLPPELGNITSPMFLLFFFNKLTGTIPESLGKLQSLTGFNVDFNQMTGTLPPSLGNLTNMGWMGLKGNRFTGGIPSSFQNLGRMWRLRLQNNMLSGPLLPELGNMTAMQQLSLESNAFTGPLPATFRNLVNMKNLFLSNNKLSGAIPPRIFSAFANSDTLQLDHNNFSGSISPEVGNMLLLRLLDLSYNSFSGPIPESIKGCKNLNALNLSNNQLTGELPLAALESLNLTGFSVANNSLGGPIPSSVGAFAKFNSSAYAGNRGLCGSLLGVNCSNTTIPSNNEETSCSGISPTCHRQIFYGIIIAGSAVALLGVLTVVVCLCACCRKGKFSRIEGTLKESSGGEEDGKEISHFTKDITKSLTLEELRSATNGFCAASTIGMGGQSIVFKAVLPESGGQMVAVKVLHGDLGEQTTMYQLFNEVKVLANIRHRNLVSFYGFCANAELKALFVEYVPNGALDTYLHPGGRNGTEKCTLDLATRLQIATGVANALSYLHHECPKPVIHRDLKPANILLDADLNAKVSDFGISKHIKPGGVNEVSASYLCGTLGYIPPEYATTNRISTEGDVYSYGILLLELLTGHSPTAEIFAYGETIVSWVTQAFPDRVEDVLDDALVEELPSHEVQLQMLLRVGLSCAREAPKKRPSMRDVQAMLAQAGGRGVDAEYPSLKELAKQPPTNSGHALKLDKLPHRPTWARSPRNVYDGAKPDGEEETSSGFR